MALDLLLAAGAALVVFAIVGVAGYVFMALALGAVFRKFGGRPGMAWIPILNLVEMARVARTAVTATVVATSSAVILAVLGGALSMVAPAVGAIFTVLGAIASIAVWVLFIVQAHRLGLEHNIPGAMVVVAALAPAVWAAVVGWSSMGRSPEPGPITGAVPIASIQRQDLASSEIGVHPGSEAHAFPVASPEPTAAPHPAPVTPTVPEDPQMDVVPLQGIPAPVPAAPGATPIPGVPTPPVPVASTPATEAPHAAVPEDDFEAETRIAAPVASPYLAASQGVAPAGALPQSAPVSPYLTGGAASPPPPPPGSASIPLPPFAGVPAPALAVAPEARVEELQEEAPSVFAPPAAASSPFAPVTPQPHVTPAGLAHDPNQAEPVTPLPLPEGPAPWERAAVAAPAPAPAPVAAPAPASSFAPVAPVAAPVPAAPVDLVHDDLDDDDDDDHTQISVRRRETWELVTAGGDVYPLTSGVVELGRPGGRAPADGATRVEIVDATKTISKIHARMVLDGGRWTVEDLDSTNGTALIDAAGGEQDLEPRQRTEVTGRLLIGDVEVELRRSGEA